jgi:hypothetical protein
VDTSSNLIIAGQGRKVVSLLDFTERRTKRIVNASTLAITFMVATVFAFLLEGRGHPVYWLLMSLVSLVFLTPIHELCHYYFQWAFSRQKPLLGWSSSFPYSALAEGASTTRNQGIACALAPLVIITSILVLISTAFSGLPGLLILAAAAFEVASCFGDAYLTGWFAKHKRHLSWCSIGLANVLYEESS